MLRSFRIGTQTETLKSLAPAVLLVLLLAATAGCTVQDAEQGAARRAAQSGESSTGLNGSVDIDGSSTVYPISQKVAEAFREMHPDVQIAVGLSGTGGGFEKFARGEIDINDASRPIKETEVKRCAENGIEFLEVKIAIDGLSVVVNPANDWCDCLTIAQLHQLWKPGSTIQTWRELESAWPDEKIELYGPDTDSGTFDYFTEVVNGEEGASRTSYSASADDNLLVQGVSGNKFALGYFGYAYYTANEDKLKALGISAAEDGSACVKPSEQTVESGQYAPLSRPLHLYVNKASLQKPQVARFLQFYLAEGQGLVKEAGYVQLNRDAQQEARAALDAALAKD